MLRGATSMLTGPNPMLAGALTEQDDKNDYAGESVSA